ncbi:MAG: sigma-70 family RNA polymerase sigma factor [Planctomycetes bacterium]|nr:sigma-70 family RNA polymerase sigma factor [Planctomycetota bacterium]
MTAHDPRPTTRIESLLTQHAWVRGLARKLVRSDADADDLAQEAWLAAVKSPPRSESAARGWFAAVLRNGSRQAHRGATRRDRCEQGAAHDEAGPSAVDVVARAEEHRRVVDAVLALDEPYRTVILLRFFDDLPPRDVAERTGAPVETVRSQVQRALVKLRDRLDAAHGGDGTTWVTALLPLAGLRAAEIAAAVAGTTEGAGSATAGSHAGSHVGAQVGSQAGSGAAAGAISSPAAALSIGAFTMGAKAVVLTGFVALAAGAGIVWMAGAATRDEVVRLRDESAAARASVGAAQSETKAAKDAAAKAQSHVTELEAQIAESKKALAAAKDQASKAVAETESLAAEVAKLRPAGAPKAAAMLKPTFAFEGFGDALEQVDWKSVAIHTTAMVDPIREIAEALVAGTPVPLKAAGEAQKHNGPLIQAIGALKEQIPGTGPNGAYTHPAFQVNALAAALEQIGKPLTAAQRTALEDVGRRFTEEERKRNASYDENTFQMQKLVEEGALKDRFFNALRSAISTEQLDAVSPPAVRDRLGADLWSEGLLWVTVTRPVRFAKKEELADSVGRTMNLVLKLDDGQKAKAAATVSDWVSHLPKDLMERTLDPLEAAGMGKSETAAQAAGETRKLVERLVADLALAGDQLGAARRLGVVLLPSPSSDGE